MIYSYCKHCKIDSPGDICTQCGKRASAGSMRNMWSISSLPLADGRTWRAALLSLLGAGALILAVVLGLESIFVSPAHAFRLLQGNLLRVILALVPVGLTVVFLFLLVQGKEVDIFVLDHQGAHLQTWHAPQPWKSWARLQSADPEKNIQQQDGTVMHKSQERHIQWKDVQKVKYLPQRSSICLYHTPHCAPMILQMPPQEYNQAEADIKKICRGK